jgi:hypothetical protein
LYEIDPGSFFTLTGSRQSPSTKFISEDLQKKREHASRSFYKINIFLINKIPTHFFAPKGNKDPIDLNLPPLDIKTVITLFYVGYIFFGVDL